MPPTVQLTREEQELVASYKSSGLPPYKTAVRDFLTDYNKKLGYGTTDEDLADTLLGASKKVWTGDSDEHRWYILQETVVEIDGKFILFDDYIITGDNSMRDMDLEYDLDAARFVERKERVETVVYYE